MSIPFVTLWHSICHALAFHLSRLLALHSICHAVLHFICHKWLSLKAWFGHRSSAVPVGPIELSSEQLVPLTAKPVSRGNP